MKMQTQGVIFIALLFSKDKIAFAIIFKVMSGYIKKRRFIFQYQLASPLLVSSNNFYFI